MVIGKFKVAIDVGQVISDSGGRVIAAYKPATKGGEIHGLLPEPHKGGGDHQEGNKPF